MRAAIVKFRTQNKKETDIAKVLNIDELTVWDTIKRFRELKTLGDHLRRGYKRSVRKRQMKRGIRHRIKLNSGVLMRKMAKTLEMSKKSVKLILHLDLHLKSCKLCKYHYLNDEMKLNRLKDQRFSWTKFVRVTITKFGSQMKRFSLWSDITAIKMITNR